MVKHITYRWLETLQTPWLFSGRYFDNKQTKQNLTLKPKDSNFSDVSL